MASLMVACAPAQTSYHPSGNGIIDVVVPYGTGGGTDTWARFITPYFASMQPEVNRYQVENIPGGESITGTNAYVHAGVVDGNQTLVASATTYFQSMLGHPAAEFRFNEMEPLVLNGTGAVLWTGADSGITSVEDLINREEESLYGGMSATGLDLVPLLALEALGAPVKGVFGMEGRGPSRLAVQRGETDLDFQTTASYLSQVQPFVETGEAIPLFSVGILENGEVVRDPNVPDIPTFAEVYEKYGGKTEEQRKAYEAYQAFVTPGFFYQKGLWANKDTADDVIDQYDQMVSALNTDPQFFDEAESALGGYQLLSGKQHRETFRKALELDPEVMHFTNELLAEKYAAPVHG
ncbi:hypothetical protein EAH68_02375 [Corynebacterium hylobatis]|uniref:Tripartite tricarboxylate transporter substrate binding protein n=1 Tax=Corynebacterium hylobatis TaxID=1859290 RepID=A0A430I187_9CORY|nr:hypothetical protein [Corynebacterium hylobatis]RSZ65613.1 hypothetical protein EAH68_02375 [Corynebacterium hylobatis]